MVLPTQSNLTFLTSAKCSDQHAPTREGSKKEARERATNTMLPTGARRTIQCIPNDQEEEATTQQENKSREHKRVAKS